MPHVTATDFAGNEGAASTIGVTIAVPGWVTPVTLTLREVAPNPLRSRARVDFDLPEATTVRLLLFDVGGRLIRTLTEGTYPAGHHVVPLESIDGSGRALVPGAYLLRLETGSVRMSRRVIVVE